MFLKLFILATLSSASVCVLAPLVVVVWQLKLAGVEVSQAGLVIAAFPLAGAGAGYLISQIIATSTRSMILLGFLLAATLVFQGQAIYQLPNIFAQSTTTAINTAAIVALVGSKVIFVSSVVAIVMSFLVISIELPLAWISKGIKITVSLSSLRPIIICAALALSFNLIIGLSISELAPSSLLFELGAR